MSQTSITPESSIKSKSGWPMLALFLVLGLCYATLFVMGINFAEGGNEQKGVPMLLSGLFLSAVNLFCMRGFFIVEPNQARVMLLFGHYKGTVREGGFFWTNPFTNKACVSLRAHNLDGSMLKVNDLLGNPVEISAVVVWRVADTARASFDVEDYEEYVKVQSEAAVRHLATRYPYDDLQDEGAEITLRGSTEEIAKELEIELGGRLKEAGIEVIEARLNHLAYAQEIASAMLQRQQASAIIAARKQIVEGAVGMVEQALNSLSERQVVDLDDERKATMVGNLLVVLCGQENAQPILNTGSLYN
ncbi:MAG: regulator of protease activity HflC (stomatin/prohibitin superfamily) [Planctomycetota bacterium]|jgi:regulator of protease activity HflC (stomatin/prohibitin superfamily)